MGTTVPPDPHIQWCAESAICTGEEQCMRSPSYVPDLQGRHQLKSCAAINYGGRFLGGGDLHCSHRRTPKGSVCL